MILGKTQELVVKRLAPQGIYVGLKEEARELDVLLPKKYVPEDTKEDDKIICFVLKDNDNRLIATTQKPLAEVGEFALLEVVDLTRIGAFLDWGLDKDLLLPFSEQRGKLKVGDKVFIYVYIDKSQRIAATMKTDDFFEIPKDIQENDWLEAMVYSKNRDLGSFVLVEGKYNGLIPRDQEKGAIFLGQKLKVRVENVKPDGKLDLTMFSRSHEELEKDAHRIYSVVKSNGGFLRVNDYSDPKDIRMLFDISKAQFKRSLGRLLKEDLVEFYQDGIRIK